MTGPIIYRLIIGTFVLTPSKFGVLTRNFLTNYAARIGAVIEVAMLPFPLADRKN